jgi:hypothetical protein
MANAKWTVMVLMGANNLPGQEGSLQKFARADLDEMSAVGSHDGVLNIVVQIDQPKNKGGAERFKVTNNGQTPREQLPDGQGNSGDPHVLEHFLLWAKKNYPADHFLLVLWGHAYDLAFNRDPQDPEGLDFPKLSAVLQKTFGRKKLDIVAFDSCNTGLIEAAYQLRETASYLVASQFSDPLPGWPYQKILSRVLTDRNYENKHYTHLAAGEDGPKDFGRAIVSQFVRNYTGKISATMTMMDLSQVEDVADEVQQLAMVLALAVQTDAAERARVTDIFRRCQVPSLKPEGQPTVDLMNLCWNLANFSGSNEVRVAAAAVGDSLLIPAKTPESAMDGENALIVAHARNDLVVAMLQGVSIFAPNVVRMNHVDRISLQTKYSELDFAQRTHWGDLVFALAAPDL